MVSIITVCFNACQELETTLKSVIEASGCYPDIEHVIVDGGSVDGTAELVARYAPLLQEHHILLQFKSEKDAGIYDAMNKGAERATGDWCIYMNAGDYFVRPDSLQRLVEQSWNADADCNIIYGDTIHYYRGKYKYFKAKEPQKLTYSSGMEFCHQSCLIRKDYQVKNRYSLQYQIAGDYDFFARVFSKGCNYRYVEYPIAVFEKEGASSTNGSVVLLENAAIAGKYGLQNQAVCKKRIISAQRKMRIRKWIPKTLINNRREQIMKRATESWADSVEQAIQQK